MTMRVFWLLLSAARYTLMSMMISITDPYCRANDENALEADFGAFDSKIPHLALPSSIGNGLSFVSKVLSSKVSGKSTKIQILVDYLLALNHREEVSART